MARDIILMTPPYHTGIIEITGKWPPLNLVYLAGHLRKAGHRIEIYDAMTLNHTLDEVGRKLEERRPDVVLIGAFTASINAALDVLALAKKLDSGIVTVLGGVHPTYCYAEILNDHGGIVDYIVRGEGEITSVQLIDALESGGDLREIPGLAYVDEGELVTTTERELVEDLDTLVAAWDLLDWSEYHYRITERRLAVIGSSRGCNHKCSFCSQHNFWQGKYRERSAEAMVSEIEHLYREYGIGMFMFADEYSTYNSQRWEKILDLLIEKNMDVHFSLETRVNDILRDHDILFKYRQAGVIHVYLGVESVHQEILDRFKKELTVEQAKEAIGLLNKAEIITECSFILGSPEETMANIAFTLEQAMDFNPDLAHFLLAMPWPHTEFYHQVKEHIVEFDYSKYHLVHPIIKPIEMTTEELWEQLINCFRVFYVNKYKQYMAEEPGFKRDYMVKSMSIMVEEFFQNNFGPLPIEQR
ncbi:MAG: radical SAM protein [Clostridia bacterium]|nr:radical SAM protein [Clostridia bacterium]